MVGPVKIRRKLRRCEKAPTQGEESGSIGYNIPTIESDLVLTRPVLTFQVWNAGKATLSPKGRQEGSEQPRQPIWKPRMKSFEDQFYVYIRP